MRSSNEPVKIIIALLIIPLEKTVSLLYLYRPTRSGVMIKLEISIYHYREW